MYLEASPTELKLTILLLDMLSDIPHLFDQALR